MDAHRDTIMVWLGNGISLGAIITTFAGLTPAIAAFVAAVWYLVKIYESKTVQEWLAKKRHRRLARLRAEIASLEAKLLPPPPPSDD